MCIQCTCNKQEGGGVRVEERASCHSWCWCHGSSSPQYGHHFRCHDLSFPKCSQSRHHDCSPPMFGYHSSQHCGSTRSSRHHGSSSPKGHRSSLNDCSSSAYLSSRYLKSISDHTSWCRTSLLNIFIHPRLALSQACRLLQSIIRYGGYSLLWRMPTLTLYLVHMYLLTRADAYTSAHTQD